MVFPLYDKNPFIFKSPPYVTWGLIAATIAVFVWMVSVEISGSNSKTAVLLSLTFTPAGVGPNLIPAAFVPWPFTLVSYAFLHGSILHLIGNMAFLWVFGDDVEEALGHLRFLLFYLLSAAAGALGHWASDPASDIPLIGASGAVAGIVGAYLMLHPCRKIWVLAFARIPIRLAAQWVIGAWLALQYFNILVGADQDVAWWTHIAGFAAGALLVVFLRRPGVKLFDCDADRLVQNQSAPPLKHWPKRVDTQ